MNGRPFSKDAAFASLASLAVHFVVATACYFSFAQAPPSLELPQVLTVSLVSPFGPNKVEKPSLIPETGERAPPQGWEEDKKGAGLPVPVTTPMEGREFPEKSKMSPVVEREGSPGVVVPYEKDSNLQGLSISYRAPQPTGQKTDQNLPLVSGGGYSNPPSKGAAFPAGEDYASGPGKGPASGGAVLPSGYAKAEPQAGGTLTLASPRYRENSLPLYPLLARRRGYAGGVVLSAEVLTDGTVGRLELKKTSGYDLLDRSALEAVKGWKFSPGKKMGTPVNMWVDVPVRFELN